MNKKIVALLLVIVFACSLLLSCGKTKLDKAREIIDNTNIDNTRKPETIRFFMLTDGAIEDETRIGMQNKFNQELLKFSTTVEFVFVADEASYYALLDEQLAAAKAGEGNENTTPDIFLSTRFDWLQGKVMAGDVLNVSSYINDLNTYRRLTDEKVRKSIPGAAPGAAVPSYNPTGAKVLFESGYICVDTYASDASATPTSSKEYFGLPCSYVVGNYEFLVINKAYAESKQLDHFFSDDATQAEKTNAQSQLERELTQDGITGDDRLAYLRRVSGSYEQMLAYKNQADTIVSILVKPTADYKTDIFGAMLCLSSYCKCPDRAFEVLVELYTNPRLHTILQYGIEGRTYDFDANTQTVTLRTGEGVPYYSINPRYTGNAFCIYPCTTNGESYEGLYYGFLQNSDVKAPDMVVLKVFVSRGALYQTISDKYAGFVAEGKESKSGDDSLYFESDIIANLDDPSQEPTVVGQLRYGKYNDRDVYYLEIEKDERILKIDVSRTVTETERGARYSYTYKENDSVLSLTREADKLPAATLTFVGKYLDKEVEEDGNIVVTTYDGQFTIEPAAYTRDSSVSYSDTNFKKDGTTTKDATAITTANIGTTELVSHMLELLDMLGEEISFGLSDFGFSKY